MYDDLEGKIQAEIDEKLKNIDEDMKNINILKEYLETIIKLKRKVGVV